MRGVITTALVLLIYAVCGVILYFLTPSLPYPVALGLGFSGFTRSSDESASSRAAVQRAGAPKYVRNVGELPFSTREWMSESRTIDWYQIKADFPAGTVLYVKAKPSQDLDIQISLINDMGRATVANSGEKGVAEGLDINCEPGRVYNIAVEYLSGSGFYTLEIRKGGSNFSIDKFPFRVSNTLTVSDVQERLWHIYTTRFEVPKGAVLHAELQCEGSLDAALVLEDASGDVWIEDQKLGGQMEKTDYRVRAKGPVNVIVYGDNGEGSYKLNVSIIRMEFAIEKFPFRAARGMTKEDANSKRWHWYETVFDVPKGATIRAELYVPLTADFDLTLVDAGMHTAQSAARGLGKHERANLTVETAGHVVIIIDDVQGEGEYNLSIRETPPKKK